MTRTSCLLLAVLLAVAPTANADDGDTYYVNKGGTAYHEHGCKFVTEGATATTLGGAHELALEHRPCRTCRPPLPVEPPPPEPTIEEIAPAPEPASVPELALEPAPAVEPVERTLERLEPEPAPEAPPLPAVDETVIESPEPAPAAAAPPVVPDAEYERMAAARASRLKRRGPFGRYPLSPDLIAKAVVEGEASGGKMSGLSFKDSLSGMLSGFEGVTTGFSAEVYTPFTWIKQNAAWASKKYMKFGDDDLTDDHVKPVLRVYAHADMPNQVTARGTAGTTGVQHVIVRSTQNRGFTVAQPLTMRPDAEYAQNAFGAKVEYASQYAEFSMDEVLAISALHKKGEFFIVLIGESGEEKKFKVKSKHFSRLQ